MIYGQALQPNQFLVGEIFAGEIVDDMVKVSALQGLNLVEAGCEIGGGG